VSGVTDAGVAIRPAVNAAASAILAIWAANDDEILTVGSRRVIEAIWGCR
jgi:hypothetical protein